MTLFLAKLAWALGVVGWFIIRYPHQRRSAKTPKALVAERRREFHLMGISFWGLFVMPMIYVMFGWPAFANYRFNPYLAFIGVLVFAFSLWMFRRTHKDLGRQWSVTLEVREQHRLITEGVYRSVRHPMYSAFWLWAIAQALLLPNFVAGFAGIVGFGTLFFGRVGREEKMMLETFGDEYRDYMARTKRVVPGIY